MKNDTATTDTMTIRILPRECRKEPRTKGTPCCHVAAAHDHDDGSWYCPECLRSLHTRATPPDGHEEYLGSTDLRRDR